MLARGGGSSVDADSLFPVFSVTKAVTAVALHMQADRGLLGYDAPIADYWPEFAAHGKATATVRDAMTHRLGLPQMPVDATPERTCDWDWMVERIADLAPLYPPGTHSTYMSLTYGWVLGEIVRRVDADRRPFGQWVREEICAPLQIDDLWLGVPAERQHRVATLTAHGDPASWQRTAGPGEEPGLNEIAMPPRVGLLPDIYNRPDVQRACIPGTGGIMSAHSAARFFAMLANGGELDGVRLLSERRVRWLAEPRAGSDELDPVLGRVIPLGSGGLWLGESSGDPTVGARPNVLYHPGAGGSVAWADLDARVSVAICHNRMFGREIAQSTELHPFIRVADAIRSAAGISATAPSVDRG